MALLVDEPTDAHLAILQLLATEIDVRGQNKLRLSPSCISRTARYQDANYIGRICIELSDLELIQKVGEPGTYYEVTWRGEAYLAGELTLDEDEIEDATR